MMVVDLSHPTGRENRCFDPIYENFGFGHTLYVRLARELRRRGIESATADVYLGLATVPDQAAVLTGEFTPQTDTLLQRGVQPAFCHSLESPLVAKKFYHFMARYAGRFRHNFQFRGSAERLRGTSTTIHTLYFPMETRVPLPVYPWRQRERLVLVNGNKRALSNPGNPKAVVRTVGRQIRFRLWALFDPWLRSRELYVDRIFAIQYFSQQPGFALYGPGWDQRIPGFGVETKTAARSAYRGLIPPGARPKREVISRFKFVLCFENCVFPGYVTEKVFDCFLAGSVPVYWGAPDITDYIPRETFIDYRELGSFGELDRFLRNLTEPEGLRYVQAAREFLSSAAYEKFYVDTIVREMSDLAEMILAQ